MPYSRPTLTALQQDVANAINGSLPGADAQLRFSYLGVLARAQAGLAHMHYGYLDYIATQAVPFTCSAEYLEAWAALKGVTRQPAAQASGTVTFTGQPGTTIAQGTAITRSDGLQYTATSAATVAAGGTATVPVIAVADPAGLAGSMGNAPQGQRMVLAQSLAGVQSVGSAASDLTGGADIETDSALRLRMLAAYQTPPQAGTVADYVAWAKRVPGVSRAWSIPNGLGVGTVLVYIMLDDLRAASNGLPVGSGGVATNEARGIAATGDQLAVANTLYPLQPAIGLVYVVAPLPKTINFTVQGLPATMQASIAQAIAGVLVDKGQIGGGIDFGAVWASVASLAAGAPFVLSPAVDIVCGAGELPVLGTVTML
jgi:uncharacterized phage protein gp47/JayE